VILEPCEILFTASVPTRVRDFVVQCCLNDMMRAKPKYCASSIIAPGDYEAVGLETTLIDVSSETTTGDVSMEPQGKKAACFCAAVTRPDMASTVRRNEIFSELVAVASIATLALYCRDRIALIVCTWN
jgi:hypothetical protein